MPLPPPDTSQPAIMNFLAAADDELAMMEERGDRVAYEWPAAAMPLFTPAQGRAVLAWLRSLLASAEWGR
jgi:hypothetical protein